ncbi:ataxin-3 [Cryptococcus neoformans Tu401-1]|nr:ataxin-3 [Cryptococcus neoformans var. grubii Bt85]OXG13967.1 ataxin-3 [Cryptococcus neoformans var. grubii Tu401-1]OXM77387.1 ataxin-3 [Cryptococcus neoformans var. grubii Bt63]
MDLVPYMYYEKQEAGSQLCAQHCLNNLLQQYTYSEFDLADIAKRLDQAENATLDVNHQLRKSYNYDDTGYFSISVLERALEVWDLTMVRWRGEAMKPYQDHPEDQAAFILNLASHWFALRRFAPNPPHAAASKRWYNLNSFLPNGPEWISPTYLHMVLTQAEQEGYSVFVIRKATPGTKEGEEAGEAEGWGDGGIGQLPESLGDVMAVELGEPVGRSGGLLSGTNGPTRESKTTQLTTPANPDTTTVDAGPSSSPPRPPRRRRQPDLSSDPTEVVDDPYARPAPSRSRQSSSRSNPAQYQAVGDDEDDIFDQTHGIPSHYDETPTDENVNDDFEMSHSRPYAGTMDFQFQSRSYDDEDEALQAALKASMADLPEGWEMPDILKPESERQAFTTTTTTTATTTTTPPVAPEMQREETPVATPPVEEEDIVESNEVEDDSDDVQPAEEPSPEEIRRRRLARFG